MSNYLFGFGFIQSKNDYSLYIKNCDTGFVLLLVYVDDIVITGNNESLIESVKQFLKTQFQIKDLGLLRFFLGIEVVRTDKGLCMSQRKRK